MPHFHPESAVIISAIVGKLTISIFAILPFSRFCSRRARKLQISAWRRVKADFFARANASSAYFSAVACPHFYQRSVPMRGEYLLHNQQYQIGGMIEELLPDAF